MNVKLMTATAKLPTRGTEYAAGLDLYADQDALVGHGTASVLIKTGIAVEIPAGYQGEIRPRSSISALGIITHLGTIDADYRGELQVCMSCVAKLGKTFKRGDRIAQLVITPCLMEPAVSTDELSATVRNTGGFGSTGV